jgi:deoxycytidine triphosphate deaminase
MIETKEEFLLYANNELSKDDNEAEQRYNKYKNKDPFPDIDPALLNSADIFKYVAATGMIYPFRMEDLAGATYKVRIQGASLYWDDENNKHENNIVKENKSKKDSNKIVLKPNSITFLTLEPMFRLPHYMAIRFNLRIKNVYRGLLLGTGPIVDPGFCGKLSLPLHNLTLNTYEFEALDDLISIEITKLSYNQKWDINPNEKDEKLPEGFYIQNEFGIRTVYDYVNAALLGTNASSVRSSVPEELKKIREDAKKAVKDTATAKRNNIIITIATVVGICALFYTSYNLISATNNRLDSIYKDSQEIKVLQQKVDYQQNIINQMNDKIKILESKQKS